MYENRSYTSWVTDNHRLFLEMFSKTDSTADCSERLNFCKELRPFIIQQRMHKMHISRYYLCKQNVMGTIYARLLRTLWFQLRLLAMHWHRLHQIWHPTNTKLCLLPSKIVLMTTCSAQEVNTQFRRNWFPIMIISPCLKKAHFQTPFLTTQTYPN